MESESIIEEMADDAVEESVDPAVDSEMDAPAVDAAEVASDES